MLWSKRACAVVGMVLLTLAVSSCGLMRGNDYPASDITFIVPYAPGGTSDPVARLAAGEAEKILGKKMVIVNKPGASATLGTAEIVKAKPDGYTIGLGDATAVAVQPQITNLPYNRVGDYTPIIGLVQIPQALVVSANAPWKNLNEFVADAKKRPGAIRISTSGKLAGADMALRSFEQVAGFDATDVPFTGGGGEAITALLGGHVEGTISYVTTARTHAEAGKLRILGVLQGPRSANVPDVDSALELGYKVPAPGAMYFVMGPKGMDKAIVDKLYKAFDQAVKGEKFQKWAKENDEIVEPSNPEEMIGRINGWWDAYGSILKGLNIEKK